ncbi:hypothetical protein B4113_2060 [Geobacillus sp. B4113_201601]|nr:hypothetical protein B4113_2060 [Geobacillus sp. B4113_201601]
MMLGLALDFSKPVIKPLVHLVDALTTKNSSMSPKGYVFVF